MAHANTRALGSKSGAKKTRLPSKLAKSRATAKFIHDNAKKPKQFYNEVGLAEDPNKVIGLSKKKLKSKRKNQETSEFVKELEAEASKPTKKKFKFGKEMCKELDYYIEKYGQDYQAMARDKKNIYQDSPGQLRYKILKYLKLHKPGQL